MRKGLKICLLIISLAVMALFVSLPGAEAADQALIEAAKKEGKFVQYTGLPTDTAVALLDAFKKKYPFLDTSEYFRSTSYRIYSRVNVEVQAGKHLADCVTTGLMTPFLEWRKKGWLMKYDAAGYQSLPKNIQDPGYWAPMRLADMVIGYNSTLLPKQDIPTKWTDLLDPKWEGAIGVEGSDSGSQHSQYWILKKVYGESYWDKLLKNRPKIFGGQGAMMTGLLRGEIKLAMHALGYMIYNYRELQKAPIQGVWPKDCVPMYIGPVALMEKAPHPNAAKLFMDWILSQEGQEAMVQVVGAYSARSDVAPARGNPPMNTYNPVFTDDYDAFAESTDEFKKAWQSLK